MSDVFEQARHYLHDPSTDKREFMAWWLDHYKSAPEHLSDYVDEHMRRRWWQDYAWRVGEIIERVTRELQTGARVNHPFVAGMLSGLSPIYRINGYSEGCTDISFWAPPGLRWTVRVERQREGFGWVAAPGLGTAFVDSDADEDWTYGYTPRQYLPTAEAVARRLVQWVLWSNVECERAMAGEDAA